MHPPGDHRLGQFQLKRHKSPFRTDHHHCRAWGLIRQPHRCTHICNPARPITTQANQFVFHEWAKTRMEVHLGSNGVAGPLHSRHQSVFQLFGREQGALPVALLHPSAVDQMQVLHTKLSHGAQDATQHLGPRQSQHQIKGMARWGWCCQLYLQHHGSRLNKHHLSNADLFAPHPHPHGVAHRGTKLAEDVLGTVITQPHPVWCQPAIPLPQQYQIHGRSQPFPASLPALTDPSTPVMLMQASALK